VLKLNIVNLFQFRLGSSGLKMVQHSVALDWIRTIQRSTQTTFCVDLLLK